MNIGSNVKTGDDVAIKLVSKLLMNYYNDNQNN